MPTFTLLGIQLGYYAVYRPPAATSVRCAQIIGITPFNSNFLNVCDLINSNRNRNSIYIVEPCGKVCTLFYMAI